MPPSLSVPTPIEPVSLPGFADRGIALYVKRDDLIHPRIIGNKLRKSLPHFKKFESSGCTSILTFGGRFSNHLLAVAQASHASGIATAGVVRGTDNRGTSGVLDECRQLGMQILAVGTKDYPLLQRMDAGDLKMKLGLNSPPYVIPEGGTSSLAIEGVGRIIDEIADPGSYAYIICAVGTGGTAAGLAWGLAQRPELQLPKVLAVAILKGYAHLPEQGQSALRKQAGDAAAKRILSRHLEFDGSAPWGRYGKPPASVLARLRALQDAVSFPVDYVYTGKALLQLEQLVLAGRFARGSRLLFLHTGGYQTAPILSG